MKTQLTRSKNGAISGNKSKATKAGLSESVTVNWTAPIKQQQLVDGKAKGVAASALSRKVASPAVPLGWVQHKNLNATKSEAQTVKAVRASDQSTK